MADSAFTAAIRSAGLEVAVVTSLDVCKEAQKAHHLDLTPAIALGRLLTATALVALSSKRTGSTSLQVISNGRLRQIYADATHTGDLRGFTKNIQLNLPVTSSEELLGRRELKIALLPGKLHVVRAEGDGAFGQGTVDLISGEIDLDVEHFLHQSDQVPTALACDVLASPDDQILGAGGILVQALPGGDLERLAEIREAVHSRALVDVLRNGGDGTAILAALAPGAVLVEAPRSIQWKCRCTREKVLGALALLHPSELASMVDREESAKVGCDLCGTQYVVEPAEIVQVFFGTIKAQG